MVARRVGHNTAAGRQRGIRPTTRMLGVLCALGLVLTLAAPDAHARRRRKGKGAVAVKCTVKGAAVLVNGKEVGKTPIKQLALTSGNHTIKVRKLGFLDFTEEVTVRAGKTVRVLADLLPFAGVIKVSSDVPGSQVFVNGKSVGKAPLEHEVSLGKRVITVKAPGYNSFSQTIRADPGNTYSIVAKFIALSDDDGDDDDAAAGLTLAPLGSNGGTNGKASGAGDDLALEPLKSPSDDLALEPLQNPNGGSLTDLPLAAMPEGASNSQVIPGLGKTVEPPKPWYERWYVLAGAGAVVVTGVVVGYMLLSGDDGEKLQIDGCLGGSPNDFHNGCTP